MGRRQSISGGPRDGRGRVEAGRCDWHERPGVVGELFGMWRNTRMVVLTAICAALYAAILIPFKVAPIIPGVTELRPANALPIVCSFLFGPAGAWGAAFGNLIGDFFGGLGPGDLFGFAGNLLFGLTPYSVWDAVTGAPPVPSRRLGWWALFASVVGLSGMLCATVVGWGLGLLGFHPFTVVGSSVLVNNVVAGIGLAPLLLGLLYGRIGSAHLLYRDLLGVRPRRSLPRRALGLALLLAGTLGGFAAGQAIAARVWLPPWIAEATAAGRFELGVGVLPFLALAVLGLALL
jgi:energy-coupling factor transport system substrate-specific component